MLKNNFVELKHILLYFFKVCKIVNIVSWNFWKRINLPNKITCVHIHVIYYVFIYTGWV